LFSLPLSFLFVLLFRAFSSISLTLLFYCPHVKTTLIVVLIFLFRSSSSFLFLPSCLFLLFLSFFFLFALVLFFSILLFLGFR
jgi:hypothetical protein